MITSITTARSGDTTVVNVVSDLAGVVYYFWYEDGNYVGVTQNPSMSFVLPDGAQAQIDVLDTNDSTFDPLANAPVAYPAYRTLLFFRSLDPGIDQYRIEQQASGGAWSAIGFVSDKASAWSYQFATQRLTDLTQYAWRVVPVDAAGDDGTPVTLAAELIVRTPDAPKFAVAFDPATTKVTFSAA